MLLSLVFATLLISDQSHAQNQAEKCEDMFFVVPFETDLNVPEDIPLLRELYAFVGNTWGLYSRGLTRVKVIITDEKEDVLVRVLKLEFDTQIATPAVILTAPTKVPHDSEKVLVIQDLNNHRYSITHVEVKRQSLDIGIMYRLIQGYLRPLEHPQTRFVVTPTLVLRRTDPQLPFQVFLEWRDKLLELSYVDAGMVQADLVTLKLLSEDSKSAELKYALQIKVEDVNEQLSEDETPEQWLSRNYHGSITAL